MYIVHMIQCTMSLYICEPFYSKLHWKCHFSHLKTQINYLVLYVSLAYVSLKRDQID